MIRYIWCLFSLSFKIFDNMYLPFFHLSSPHLSTTSPFFFRLWVYPTSDLRQGGFPSILDGTSPQRHYQSIVGLAKTMWFIQECFRRRLINLLTFYDFFRKAIDLQYQIHSFSFNLLKFFLSNYLKISNINANSAFEMALKLVPVLSIQLSFCSPILAIFCSSPVLHLLAVLVPHFHDHQSLFFFSSEVVQD